MSDKKLGIINHSGGIRSWNHGAPQLMASLSMHNNITVIQPVVHSWSADFDENNQIREEKVLEKMEDMFTSLLK